MPDSGGPPRTLVSVDPATERATQPQRLDDGKHLLYVVIPRGSVGDEGQIVVQALDGSGRKVLVSGARSHHADPVFADVSSRVS